MIKTIIFKVRCMIWYLENIFKPNSNNTNKKNRVSIVTIIKNEGLYIKEWIDFHRKMNVDHFYIYDNGSTDQTVHELTSYVRNGIVTLIPWEGVAMQLPAYNHAIRNFKNETEFMAFLDGDEFLIPINGVNLYKVIKEIFNMDIDAGGIAVNWRVYGSSGHVTRPKGGVIKNFLYRAKDEGQGNNCIKTIVNPRKVAFWNHVHYPTYFNGFHSIDEDGKIIKDWQNIINHPLRKLRINHYFCKSQEEWIKRRSMGKADTNNICDKRTIEEFKKHDNNDIFDDIALKKMYEKQHG